MSRVFEEFKDLITPKEVNNQDEENTVIFKGEKEIMENIKKEEAAVEVAVNEPEVKEDSKNKTAEGKIIEQLKTDRNSHIPSEPISKFLINKANEDSEFAKFILIETKSMKKCFDYVEKEVIKELQKTKSGWIDDDVVYNWAVDYFKTDDAELARLEEEEKKKREELHKKTAAKNVSNKSKTKTKEKAEALLLKVKQDKKKETDQLSLFEIGGLI